ncbi:MAG: hypothetical protein ACKVS6_00815 [Planctomycetota bacterium]
MGIQSIGCGAGCSASVATERVRLAPAPEPKEIDKLTEDSLDISAEARAAVGLIENAAAGAQPPTQQIPRIDVLA